ncbi:hypothetical protein PLCT2_00469 [Planctomycetaceae bacterium]|nr:hypothetical protein PLCT2_00469 [Planctomycetaceae bacterium]
MPLDRKCPSCGASEATTLETPGVLRCSYCDLEFADPLTGAMASVGSGSEASGKSIHPTGKRRLIVVLAIALFVVLALGSIGATWAHSIRSRELERARESRAAIHSANLEKEFARARELDVSGLSAEAYLVLFDALSKNPMASQELRRQAEQLLGTLQAKRNVAEEKLLQEHIANAREALRIDDADRAVEQLQAAYRLGFAPSNNKVFFLLREVETARQDDTLRRMLASLTPTEIETFVAEGRVRELYPATDKDVCGYFNRRVLANQRQARVLWEEGLEIFDIELADSLRRQGFAERGLILPLERLRKTSLHLKELAPSIRPSNGSFTEYVWDKPGVYQLVASGPKADVRRVRISVSLKQGQIGPEGDALALVEAVLKTSFDKDKCKSILVEIANSGQTSVYLGERNSMKLRAWTNETDQARTLQLDMWREGRD